MSGPLYLVIGHHHPPKWSILLWLGYGATGLTCLILYITSHSELRTPPTEKARRLAMVDPRKAKVWTIVFLTGNFALCAIFLVFYREPPSNLVCAQGAERARAIWALYRGGNMG
jgi:hypothetical protein